MYNMFGMPPQMEIPKVQGLSGAQAFAMGASSSALLLDQNDPIVWLVKTDATGAKVVCSPFDISPHVTPQPLTSNDLQSIAERLDRIEERVRQYESNIKYVEPKYTVT